MIPYNAAMKPLLLILVWQALVVFFPGQQNDEHHVRGMTVSCPTYGPEWGSDAMVQTMKDLKTLGVSWVAIHPYAQIGNEGRVYSRSLGDPEKAPRWVTRPIDEAHALGMKFLMKPHISYWGSRFSWRGEIDFQKEKEVNRFFADYERFIVSMAKISQKADAFVIGTELDRLLRFEKQWRRIIKAVRKHYKGPVTYAANWTEYEKVPFWDALDCIGIQAYFPLIAEGQKNPDRKTIRLGWQQVVKRLEAFSQLTGKKICFTELGYNKSSRAASHPWEYQVGGAGAEELQKICLDEALKAIDASKSVVGAFLWKWFPGRARPRNFNKESQAMRAVIKSRWHQSEPKKKTPSPPK